MSPMSFVRRSRLRWDHWRKSCCKWGSVPQPVRERLQVVERNQERLLLLINQSLDLTRMEGLASELHPERIVDVNELVLDCVAQFRPAAEARGLELNLSLDPALSAAPLLADREKLECAVLNLLSNALKFTDQGQVEVKTSKREGMLDVVVADTGIGIADEDLPHVFDRLRHAVGSSSRRSTGSGIGLALVKRIAEHHHGQVEVQSRKGNGSRFTLRLPFVSASETTLEQQSSAEHRQSSQPFLAARDLSRDRADDRACIDPLNRAVEAAFDAGKPIVLCVEDDAEQRDQVQCSLADVFNVLMARDGVDGLEKARRYWPDAIICDQIMPRMNGWDFLVAMRDDAELRSIPVVFLTARHGTEGRIESLDAGADDCITKPFHEAELRARLTNLIRARGQERELARLNRRLRLQVREQTTELAKAGELEQFLPRPLVDSLRLAVGARPQPMRRQVTVLVTELTALAALSERLEEPAVAAIVNEYIDAISSICFARGAVIDGLSGGRVSALFGAADGSGAAEAALSAAQAAFEIRRTTQQVNADARRRGPSVDQIRGIAIASGTCMIGTFGGETLRTYTAIGTATRAAARLHDAVPAGAIACDSSTRSLLGQRARARELEGLCYEITSLTSDAEPELSEAPLLRQPNTAARDRVFRREGEYWTIVHSDRVFRLKTSKGVLYLGHLLARPHVEIHVMDLAQAMEREEPSQRAVSFSEASELGLRATAGDGVVPALDGRAKRAYRGRLRELEEQLERARNFGDTERARRAEAEKAELARELAAAMGLGGRDRAASAAAERFRVNVTRTVKAVLQKIMQENAELGRHLAASIHTGTFCCYAPDSGLPDGWHVSF